MLMESLREHNERRSRLLLLFHPVALSAAPSTPFAAPSAPGVCGKRKARTTSYRKAKMQTGEGVHGRRPVRDNVEDEASYIPVGSRSRGSANGDEACRAVMEETTTSQP
ncbi:hypothetical protein Sjap_013263 [Stephania japonica]|uniref:Uncharacterized protein n=1 Tax=Stephania japonica TaxID=461633 RepID=A0AAP0J024_9MAGN